MKVLPIYRSQDKFQIQTLLKRPDVQHLVIIGKKDVDDEETVKGVVVINGNSISKIKNFKLIV